MIIARSDLTLSSHALDTTTIYGGSGARKTAYRCQSCGSNLYGLSESMPGCASLRPGTLNDSSWFTPLAHIWTQSKQAWVQLPPGVPAFKQAYDRERVWPQASLQRLDRILSGSPTQ